MFNWRVHPFIRLLLPFLVGILIADQFEQLALISYWFLILCFLLILVVGSIKNKWRNTYSFAGLCYLFLFVFGIIHSTKHHEKNQVHHFQNYLTEENLLQVQVKEMPIKEDRMKLLVEVLRIGENLESLNSSSGNLWLYLDYKVPSRNLQYGDQLLLKAKLMPIPKAQNPEAFDYARFMHLKNIHYQAFVKADQWESLQINNGHPILSAAYSLRSKFLAFLKKHLHTKNEFAVGAALILGYKEAIDEQLSDAYTSTGAMHVLAVSGLHVGLIYLIVSFLLNLIKWQHRYFRAIKTILLLFCIFGFALLTGASASVLRAATLFSFIIIGQSLQRDANIYNSLAASAFILLLFNPYLVWDVGFQLSYLAVIGIVYFQSKIYTLWYIENPIGDYAWKLTSVALAAQITTFPISLYYFHQFPSYFFLSGLIVVPAAMFILSSGLLLFLAEIIFPALAAIIAYFLYGIIWLTNAFIFLLQQLPGGLIEGIWIDLAILGLLYLLISSVMLSIHSQQSKWLLLSLSCLVFILGQQTYKDFQASNQRKIVCYQSYKNSLIDFIDAHHCLSISSENLTMEKQKFVAQNFRWSSDIHEFDRFNFEDFPKEFNQLIYHKPYLQFYDQVFLFVDESFEENQLSALPLDYLYLRNNPKIDLEKLSNTIAIPHIIFDASNYPNKTEEWKRVCDKLQVPYSDLATDGALVINLNTN